MSKMAVTTEFLTFFLARIREIIKGYTIICPTETGTGKITNN